MDIKSKSNICFKQYFHRRVDVPCFTCTCKTSHDSHDLLQGGYIFVGLLALNMTDIRVDDQTK